ncbi:MAG: transcriptional regulator [Phycisphaerae bacterium]|nr:transcriptional regulator [Phycisphaerae bacterium]
MSGVSRVYRLLRLITMLQSGRSYTASELARELEVSRRTVFRDLNMLEMARVPYYFDADSRRYRIGQHFFLPPINLTLTEALALLTLTGRLRVSSQVPLLSQSTRAAMKLESALPSAMRQEVGNLIDRLSVRLGPTAAHRGLDAMFDDLAAATAGRKVCRMVYISFQERRQLALSVHPLRLVFVQRAWYLIAYSVRHREIRTFKLGRIRKLTVTSATFRSPADVDAETHFGEAWCMIPEGKLYDVHLHFEPKVAGNVAEVGWHRSQRVQWNDDGSMEFHVRVDGLGEITWWVLGYGDQVEVVAPPALRRKVAAVASTMAERHRQER